MDGGIGGVLAALVGIGITCLVLLAVVVLSVVDRQRGG